MEAKLLYKGKCIRSLLTNHSMTDDEVICFFGVPHVDGFYWFGSKLYHVDDLTVFWNN